MPSNLLFVVWFICTEVVRFCKRLCSQDRPEQGHRVNTGTEQMLQDMKQLLKSQLEFQQILNNKFESFNCKFEKLEQRLTDQELKFDQKFQEQQTNLNKTVEYLFDRKVEEDKIQVCDLTSKLFNAEQELSNYIVNSKVEQEQITIKVNDLENKLVELNSGITEVLSDRKDQLQAAVNQTLEAFEKRLEEKVHRIIEGLEYESKLQSYGLVDFQKVTESNLLEVNIIKPQLEALHEGSGNLSDTSGRCVDVIHKQVDKCISEYVKEREAKKGEAFADTSGIIGSKEPQSQKVENLQKVVNSETLIRNGSGLSPSSIETNANNWWEEFRSGNSSHIPIEFPYFGSEWDMHPVIFLEAFRDSLPKEWDERKKVRFVVSHLKGEVEEWGIMNFSDFTDWQTFERHFKNKYWSVGHQRELRLQLMNPPKYSQKWGGLHKFVEWHISRLKLLDNPTTEEQLMDILVRRMPIHVQEKLIDKDLTNTRAVVNYLRQLDIIYDVRQKGKAKRKRKVKEGNRNHLHSKGKSKQVFKANSGSTNTTERSSDR